MSHPPHSRPLAIVGALAGALAVLGLSACERQAPPAASEAAAPSEEFVPLPQQPGHLVAASGRISAPLPEGPGWECLEEAHGQAEAAAVALRCRREDPHEFLFFAAKTHRQPLEQRTDAKFVLMSLYRGDNEEFFDTVEYTRSEAAPLAGVSGWEAELLADHAKLGTIRKRERLAVVGDRVFAVSAEGSPELWAAHADAIEAWFAGVEFAR